MSNRKTGHTKKLLRILNENKCCTNCPPLSTDNGNSIECRSNGLYVPYVDFDNVSYFWRIGGNDDVTNDDFIGTLTSIPFNIRVNNSRAGYIGDSYDGPEGEGRGETQDIFIGKNAGPAAPNGIYPYGLIAVGNSALKNFAYSSNWQWHGNIAIGHHTLENSQHSANTAVGDKALRNLTTGRRNIAMGQGAGHSGITTSYSVFLGQFSGEWASSKWGQTMIGSESGRAGGGENDVYLGNWAGYFGGGGIIGANIINGGSGYTTATVTFSAPVWRTFGYNHGATAAGTAVITDGVITGIIMTYVGRGYSDQDVATITITGDGVGATATPIMDWPARNVLLGPKAGWQQQLGKDNIMIGYEAGIGSQASLRDTYCGYIGSSASRSSSLSTSTFLTNAWAIGRSAHVGKDNMMALGTPYTDVNTLSVGIGTNSNNANAKLQVDSTTQGVLVPRMTKSQRNAITSITEPIIVTVIGEVGGEYLSIYNTNLARWEKVSTIAD